MRRKRPCPGQHWQRQLPSPAFAFMRLGPEERHELEQAHVKALENGEVHYRRDPGSGPATHRLGTSAFLGAFRRIS